LGEVAAKSMWVLLPDVRVAAVARTIGFPLRILVVEDHGDTAATLATFLRLEGHEVAIVPDGPTAVQVTQAGRPADVVLLDIDLPGMDGWQVARRVHELLVFGIR
jgi:CheY-like chemotaxis protein